MEKIDYALAPSGATHEYNGMWRKLEDSKWFFIDGGKWVPIKAQCSDDYTPIPEREQLKNWLADQPEWTKKLPEQFKDWALFDFQVERQISNERAEVIHKSNIDKLRAARIKAGIIEVENPITSSLTNSQAKEMELDMLAATEAGEGAKYKRVSFPLGEGDLIVPDQDTRGVVIVRDDKGEYVRVSADNIRAVCTPEQIEAAAKEAKRIELANSLKEVIEFRGSRVGTDVINALVDYLDSSYGLLEAPKEGTK